MPWLYISWVLPFAKGYCPLTRILISIFILTLVGLNGCATQRSAPAPTTSTSTTTYPVPPEPATLPAGYARSYVVFGKRYYVLKSASGFSEQGLASWYGPKFHGRKTANGETYNMHGMSAAHKNLPLGTWVRVTNLNNERTIDVRINDRGPFIENRVIDLSLAAAKALDVVGPGTAPVYLETLEGTKNFTAGEVSSIPPGSGGGTVVTATIDRPAIIASRPAPQQPPVVQPEKLPPVAVSVAEPSSQVSEPVVAPSPAISPSPSVSATTNSPAYREGGFVQVASFGDRNNASRMVAQLEQSGLNNVIIQTQTVNDRVLHRVRIGPLTSASQQQEVLDTISNMGLRGARVVSK